MNPWRIGGKNSNLPSGNNYRSVYNTTYIPQSITRLVITHGVKTANITVEGMTVTVASDASFTNVISSLTPTFVANGSVTVTKPDGVTWNNCYFKIRYQLSNGTGSNHYIEFVKAEFYK